MTDYCGCDLPHEWDECRVHVRCDDGCEALLDPVSVAEYAALVVHWREHVYLAGCSHGR